MLILDKIEDNIQRVWYMEQTLINGWSYDVLAFQIKSKLYERKVITTNNNLNYKYINKKIINQEIIETLQNQN